MAEVQIEPRVDAPKSISDIGPEQFWLMIFQALNIRGVLLSTVSNCVLVNRADNQFSFVGPRQGRSF